MYAFLGIEGMDDRLAFCKRLVREHGLGLAPGAAFGPEGEGYVRWCFASSQERLAEAVPLSQEVDFLAVDEIQLAAHPQLGHVFTDRLLHARGRAETWFLGAET